MRNGTNLLNIRQLETSYSTLVELLYRQQAGLEFNALALEEQERTLSVLVESLEPAARTDPDLRSLLSAIMLEAQLAPIEQEIRQLTAQHFTFPDLLFNGQPVTPYTRYQYLYQENDPHKRHELLTRITQGHPAVDRALARHHAKRRLWATTWSFTPLDDLLQAEDLTLGQLRTLLTTLATAMRPTFTRCFAENRAAVFGDNQGEPWEDFATLFLTRWSARADAVMPPFDGVKAIRRLARAMDFAVDAITMDLEDRPRKIPGADAWGVRIPGDVRICTKPIAGVEDLAVLYHEMGHALHFVTIRPTLPYAQRMALSAGVQETFAFWLESLWSDPLYLLEIGLNEQSCAEVLRYQHFAIASFTTWLSVQALTLIDDWTEGPFTLEELGSRQSRYTAELMGITMPAAAIRAVPTLVRMLNFHAVGYPLGYVRLAHLLDQVEAIRRDWWYSPAAADVVRNYMRGGRKAGFPLSMLDIEPFIRRYAG